MWILREIESKRYLCTDKVPEEQQYLETNAILYTDEELAIRHCEAWNRFMKKIFMQVEQYS